MHRHNKSFRRTTHVAQKSDEECKEKIARFHGLVADIQKRHEFELSDIGNMDETPVYVNMPGKKNSNNILIQIK